MADSENYVCTLNEASLKVAQDELNEEPNERLSQVETFRTWIKAQKHIKAPTDTQFLLKFLRTAKYSQLRAREVLEGNLKAKTKYPEWLNDIDMADPEIVEYMSSGNFMVIPQRLPNGRLLLFNDAGKLDLKKKPNKTAMLRAMFGMSYYYTLDENDMVNGMEFFQDFTHFSMKMMTYWGTDTMKKTTKLWQGNFPGRFKAFHYYNIGPIFESIMTITKPLLSKKFQDRMKFYGKNMEEVYKVIPMEFFPVEYLPDDYKGPNQGPSQDIVDKMIADLTSPRVRDRILYETSSQWSYDFSLKPEDVPSESFRKLNVD